MHNLISDVYNNHCHENPETVLLYIKEFFMKAGDAYRRGLMTEEEFLVATHFGFVYKDLWNLKNRLYVNEKHLQDAEFLSSWKEWKETVQIKNYNWFFKTCSQCGNPNESVQWFFKVIDTLKIPLSYFKGIQDVRTFPNLLVVQDTNTVKMLLNETCINADIFQDASYRIGDRINLKYYNGNIVDLIINEIQDSTIVGEGIVRDYMNTPGRIIIRLDENGQNPDVYFNEKHFSRYEILMGTYMYSVPHPKWQSYNIARLSRALRVEAEYKILRLPYMLGHEAITEADGAKEIIDEKHQNNLGLFNFLLSDMG